MLITLPGMILLIYRPGVHTFHTMYRPQCLFSLRIYSLFVFHLLCTRQLQIPE